MSQQYPSRSSVHRPSGRPLPAPCASRDGGPGTRAERRLAERAAERRRRAQRRRTVQNGSVAAVTSAILLAGVSLDQNATADPAENRHTTDGASQVLADRSGAATRSAGRSDAAESAAREEAARGGAGETRSPVVTTDNARELANNAIARAAELVATEARTTPELREEVLGASTVILELVRRAEAVDGLGTEPAEPTGAAEPTGSTAPDGGATIADDDATDTDEATEATADSHDAAFLADAADAAILAAAESLGADPAVAAKDPEVVSYAIERMTAELETAIGAATPATIEVAPAALTPTGVLDQQVALGHDDAERLASLAGATVGHENGRLPASALTDLSWASGHRLRPDAAAQLERLNIAFHARFGHDLSITSSYRSFAGQIAARRTRGSFAATPGTSNHGWGVAVDLGSGVNRFGTATHRWMRENAPRFGWVLPSWAQENGSKPEPWHWEFEGVPVADDV